MSESYERERQNNARLEELSAKVSALRGVTVDIYDNARAQDVIDSTSDTFSSMGAQLKNSTSRIGRMAASGNKVAILKLSGILIAIFLVLYYGERDEVQEQRRAPPPARSSSHACGPTPPGYEQQLHRGSPAAPPLAPAPRCNAARGPSTVSSVAAGALELAGVRAEAAGPRAAAPPRLPCTSLPCSPDPRRTPSSSSMAARCSNRRRRSSVALPS